MILPLRFTVQGARAVEHAAAPQLALDLRVACDGPWSIHAGVLACQVRLEPRRRRYTDEERERLLDLFGPPELWARSLSTALWTHAPLVLPAFDGEVDVELPLPCSYDFNLGAVKFFDALEGGEAPLRLLFSGTVFYRGAEDEAPRVSPVSWSAEAEHRLPVALWRDLMARHYPNTAFLGLRKDVFDRLAAFKRREGLPTWEDALARLLELEQGAREGSPS